MEARQSSGATHTNHRERRCILPTLVTALSRAGRGGHARTLIQARCMPERSSGGRDLPSEPNVLWVGTLCPRRARREKHANHSGCATMHFTVRSMPAAFTAGLSMAARPSCSGFYPVTTMVQPGKRTQRRQAQAVSWAVKSSAAEPSHCLAAPLSNQARAMPAASTAG